MNGSDPARTATDAFALLGNDTRAEIIHALWDARREGDGECTFSALFDRVSTRDTGNFNYHLDRLVGHFVEQTANGYRLAQPGIAVGRAVAAGSITRAPELERTIVDRACPRCEAPVTVSYEDDFLHVRCTACEGIFATRDGDAAGTLLRTRFPPAGLVDRDPDELFNAALTNITLACLFLREGVCPACAGTVHRDLAVCDDHDAGDGRCRACGHLDPAVATGRCNVCSLERVFPLGFCVYDHPSVVAALRDVDGLDSTRSWTTSARPAAWPVTVLDDGLAQVTVSTGNGDACTVLVGPDLRIETLAPP